MFQCFNFYSIGVLWPIHYHLIGLQLPNGVMLKNTGCKTADGLGITGCICFSKGRNGRTAAVFWPTSKIEKMKVDEKRGEFGKDGWRRQRMFPPLFKLE
jgi:hypothetical protein